MKPKNLLTILLLIISLFIVGCKEKTHTHSFDHAWASDGEYHWHVCKKCKEVLDKYPHSFTLEAASKKCTICGTEVSYTVEENFDYWVKGRNYSLNYDGSYTTVQTTTLKNLNGDVLLSNDKLIESYEGTKYLRIRDEQYGSNENGVLDIHDKNIRVFKEVDDNGIKKIKHFYSSESNGSIIKYGEYVSPESCKGYTSYSPSNIVKDLYLDKGDNYYDFLECVNNYILADMDIEPLQIDFTRNTDGSVTLSLVFSFDTKFPSEDTTYLKNTYEYVIYATVKDEKLISTEYVITRNELYSDTTKNKVTVNNILSKISYEFDQEEYDKIDITTDTTTNNYYSNISFVINGHVFKNPYRFVLVGENLTSYSALDLITSNVVNVSSIEPTGMFEIYVDEDMTIPFEGFTSTDPNVTLYVKIIPVDGTSVTVTINEGDDTSYNLIYIRNSNSEYVFEDNVRSGYDVVSVNGKEITTETSFICNEKEIYIIVIKEKENN